MHAEERRLLQGEASPEAWREDGGRGGWVCVPQAGRRQTGAEQSRAEQNRTEWTDGLDGQVPEFGQTSRVGWLSLSHGGRRRRDARAAPVAHYGIDVRPAEAVSGSGFSVPWQGEGESPRGGMDPDLSSVTWGARGSPAQTARRGSASASDAHFKIFAPNVPDGQPVWRSHCDLRRVGEGSFWSTE